MPGAAEIAEVIHVRVVGALTVTRATHAVAGADLGSRKARTLLGLLAVEHGRFLSTDRLAEVLWGDDAPAHPAENIATLISRLRRQFGPDIIAGGKEGYRLGAPPVVVVDLDQAAAWIDEAERRRRSDEPALAVAAADRAQDLLAPGGVLIGEPSADWVDAARRDYDRLVARSRHVLADARLSIGDHDGARSAAHAAIVADPYDERAVRAAMRADAAAGEPAQALAVYARLRDRLADGLGADPAAETQQLHLAILRSESPLPTPTQPAAAAAVAADAPGLVGRSAELHRLRRAWNDAAAGRPGLLLVTGEAGIGKSRLCAELLEIAATTGGTVLSARCYETEQSLFLQPIVEAVGDLMRDLPPAVVRDLAAEHAATLAGLLPDAAPVLGRAPVRRPASADMEQRRAFEAAAALIRALAERGPVLLSLDDLHNAGRSTVEFLHYLMRRLRRCRLLVAATVRAEEGAEPLRALAEVSDRLDLGPLPQPAVAALAAAAGLGDHSADIMRRTRGHALYVIETVRALSAGASGIPATLDAAVSARVRRAGRAVEDMLRAAAVLGSAFDPMILAGVLGASAQSVAAGCADALSARLLVVAGREYEFAHDLVREVLYAGTPEPTRRAYHLRAADLLTDRPEALAAHSAAAGDWQRAARGFLLAGEQALARAAAGDAAALLGRSLSAAAAAGGLDDVRSRALLVRGRACAAQADYPAALRDIEAATTAAREAGDRRLEILALRELGGEVPTALGRSVGTCLEYLHRGLALATSMSDRILEADLEAWIAILAANGLRFAESVRHGAHAVRAARASGDDEALAAALDGRKTSLAYLGEVGELQPVIDELDPLLRRSGDLFRLHWAVFESAFPAVARGDWRAASDRIREALDVQRRSGFSAYAGWHIAHLGWIARLQGRYDEALELGRRSLLLCEEAPHVWCTATAGALLGTTLLEVDEIDAALAVLERARAAAQQDGAEAYVLRCVAPLAEATGSKELLDEADALLSGITAPPGSAWLLGDWCYLAVARAWLAHGQPERARATLAPLLVAARRVPWVSGLAGASLVDSQAAAVLGLHAEARRGRGRAAQLANRYRMPRIARDAEAVPTC